MRKDKLIPICVRLPRETAEAIRHMTSANRPIYQTVRDVLVAYASASKYPPLREETMQLLYRTAATAQYSSAEDMLRDLCVSFERAMRAYRNELHDDEPCNNDIIEMFEEVINEKEVSIRKHA